MHAWRWTAFGLVSLATAVGCATRPRPAINALEQENRQLEDMVYQLRAELQCKQRELEACYATRASEVKSTSGGRSEPSSDRSPESSPAPHARPSSPEIPTKIPDIEVETPGEPLPPGTLPKLFKSPEERPLPEPKSEPNSSRSPHGLQFPNLSTDARDARNAPATPVGRRQPDRGGEPPLRRVENTQVVRITLNEGLCSGYTVDQRPGDDGVLVVVEPRDAQGRIVETAGPVTAVALDPDPSLAGNASRVGRWDFTAKQIAEAWGNSDDSAGLFLELPWRAGPPRNERLVVFVRFTTDDGRNLETRREIRVDLHGKPGAEPKVAEESSPTDAGVAQRAPAERMPVIPLHRASAPDRTPATEPPAAYPAGPARISRANPPQPAARPNGASRVAWTPDRPGDATR